MKQLSLIVALLLWTLCCCNRNPYADANREYKKQARTFSKQLRQRPDDSLHTAAQWTGAVNFNMRKPNFVIIHHTAQNTCEQTLNTFTTKKTQVSAHYVICRDGTVHHMLHDQLRAWHGGVGRWGNLSDINSASIGIELDNNGSEPFAEPQLLALEMVLAALKRSHGIPTGNFIGHSDMAPGRKVDPNVQFPWKRLALAGYGHWWNDTTGVQVPTVFNHLHALRIIGYDIRDSAAAFGAFKRKYLQLESREITEEDRKVLYQLYGKYQ